MKSRFLFLMLFLSVFGVVYVRRPTPSVAAPAKGDLWVFAVGVSQYRNASISLQYADNDAETLARALQAQSGKIFRQVNTKILVNQQANRQAILQGMRAFFSQAAPDDVALIAFMGHGVIDKDTYYFLPYLADLTNLPTEGLPLTDFEGEVREVGKKVQKIVLAIDTCHAGALEIKVRGLNAREAKIGHARGVNMVEALAPKMHEAYILSSSIGEEESLEDKTYHLPGEGKGHGAFTFALLRGLRGEADLDHDRIVNVLDLFTYASAQVPKITGGLQHPYVRGEGTNFPLAETAPPPRAEQIKEANTLVQQGIEQRKQGQLDLAERDFKQAKELNPRDEVPEVLYADAQEEKSYRSDAQKQRQTVEEVKKLTADAPKDSATDDDPWNPRPMVLTFLDFKTLGKEQQNSGLHEALVQRIGQALQGMKRVRVVDRYELEKILEEFKLSAGDLADPTTRLKRGRVLIFRLLATGDIVVVSENHYIFNLRMIDAETTESTFSFSKDGKDPEQILAMADEVALTIVQRLQQEYPIRGKIIAADEREVILNIGSKHGLTPGVKMRAIVEEPMKVGNEVIAQRKRPIGTLVITAVEEKAAFARVIERKGDLVKGTKVIEALPEESSSGKSS